MIIEFDEAIDASATIALAGMFGQHALVTHWGPDGTETVDEELYEIGEVFPDDRVTLRLVLLDQMGDDDNVAPLGAPIILPCEHIVYVEVM